MEGNLQGILCAQPGAAPRQQLANLVCCWAQAGGVCLPLECPWGTLKSLKRPEGRAKRRGQQLSVVAKEGRGWREALFPEAVMRVLTLQLLALGLLTGVCRHA